MPPAAKNKRITHSDVLEVEVHPVQLVPVQRIVVRVRHVARIEIESGTGAASFQRREGHRDRNRHLSGCSKLTIKQQNSHLNNFKDFFLKILIRKRVVQFIA